MSEFQDHATAQGRMTFLVEMDWPNTGVPMTNDAARHFMATVILPTLARGDQLTKDGFVLAGGPVAGSVDLRFIVEVESAARLDELLTSVPLWAVAKTRVTPLIGFSDRRPQVLTLLHHVSEPGA